MNVDICRQWNVILVLEVFRFLFSPSNIDQSCWSEMQSRHMNDDMQSGRGRRRSTQTPLSHFNKDVWARIPAGYTRTPEIILLPGA